MSREVIISCAITGAADSVGKHPAIPVTPEQIATSAIEAAQAGAAIVHIHVRDPATGKCTAISSQLKIAATPAFIVPTAPAAATPPK